MLIKKILANSDRFSSIACFNWVNFLREHFIVDDIFVIHPSIRAYVDFIAIYCQYCLASTSFLPIDAINTVRLRVSRVVVNHRIFHSINRLSCI